MFLKLTAYVPARGFIKNGALLDLTEKVLKIWMGLHENLVARSSLYCCSFIKNRQRFPRMGSAR